MLPEWKDKKVPDIAKVYWKLPEVCLWTLTYQKLVMATAWQAAVGPPCVASWVKSFAMFYSQHSYPL